MDIGRDIKKRYLDTLKDGSWDDDDPCLDYGVRALPYFVVAFEHAINNEIRSRLIRIIWAFRDKATLPILASAIRDSYDGVWKDALDGIVTLGGTEALAILARA